jgi:uncharacterized damage-inducible protein DinB
MTYYSGKDLARSFRTVRKNTLQIAHEIPEEHYGHRAAPDTRTVAEMLAHVAANPGWQHRLHGHDGKTFVAFEDFGTYIGAANAYAATLHTKTDIVKALEEQGRVFADWLETLTDGTLGEIVGFPPPIDPATKSRFEMLLGVKEHEMHHRAQLMVVERQLGIVPHITRARAAR